MPFHPAVTHWLAARLGRPTEVQARAWAITSQRRHALIAAPTGSVPGELDQPACGSAVKAA